MIHNKRYLSPCVFVLFLPVFLLLLPLGAQEDRKENEDTSSNSRVASLVEHLRSPSFERRQQATEKLINRGRSALKEIRNQLLDDETSPDFIWRCHVIVREIKERIKREKAKTHDEDDDGDVAYLGANLDESSLGNGVSVNRIKRGTPADVSNLRTGDVITHINGKQVRNVKEAVNIIKNMNPGDRVRLKIRDGKSRHLVRLTLAAKDKNKRRSIKSRIRRQAKNRAEKSGEKKKSKKTGIEAKTVAGQKGLVITNIKEKSTAAHSDLQEGDRLMYLDGQLVDSVRTLDRIWTNQSKGASVRAIIKRNHRTKIITIRMK